MNIQNSIIVIVEFLYCAIDVMLLHYYCSIFLTSKINKRMRAFIYILATSLVFIVTTYNVYSALATLLSLIIMVVYAKICFEGKKLIMVSSVGLYFAVSGLASLLTTSLIPVLTPFASSEVLSHVFLRFFVVLITKILIFIIGYLLQKKENGNSSTPRNIKSLLFFVVIVLFVLILMFEFVFLSGRLAVADLVVIMSLVFISGVGFIGLLITKYFETKDANNNLSLLLHESNLKNQSYIQSASEQIEIMKVKHDIKNHLIALENFVSQNKIDEAIKYLKTLHNYPGLKTYVETKNETINAILNQKIAEYSNIHFKVRHDDGEYRIPSDKLTIILGNALDNAVEAVQISDAERPEIKVVLSENSMLIKLYISNHFSKTPVVENGKLVSQKDTKFSGIGMMNIYEAVKSVSGQVKYEIRDKQLFELVVLIEKLQNNQ